MKKILFIDDLYVVSNEILCDQDDLTKSFDAFVSMSIGSDKSVKVFEGVKKPVVHASNICFGEYSEPTVYSVSCSEASLSLILSLGIPPERIKPVGDVNQGQVLNTVLKIRERNEYVLSLRNIHKGKRAFIIGNGPSLTISDLNRLKKEITFASNKIYLAFKDTDWRPCYYTVCDQIVAKYNSDDINRVESTMIMPMSVNEFGCKIINGGWYEERFENKFISQVSENERKKMSLFFSRDATYGIHGGYTVIYHQIQMAYHMGIREIYLIGVDFYFNIPNKTTTDESFASLNYKNALVCQGEINHFHKDYRRKGEKWSMPRLDLQEAGFRTARNVLEADGGFIKNASRKTELKILPKVCLDSIV